MFAFDEQWFTSLFPVSFMINPLDGRNTKKPKTKTADFLVNTGILVKFFQKKPK